ncbi:hypothetical protein EVL10_17790, partial [Salmonella enterica]|nr:hypothetical protein [Salmonella enterica]
EVGSNCFYIYYSRTALADTWVALQYGLAKWRNMDQQKRLLAIDIPAHQVFTPSTHIYSAIS